RFANKFGSVSDETPVLPFLLQGPIERQGVMVRMAAGTVGADLSGVSAAGMTIHTDRFAGHEHICGAFGCRRSCMAARTTQLLVRTVIETRGGHPIGRHFRRNHGKTARLLLDHRWFEFTNIVTELARGSGEQFPLRVARPLFDFGSHKRRLVCTGPALL